MLDRILIVNRDELAVRRLPAPRAIDLEGDLLHVVIEGVLRRPRPLREEHSA